METEPLLLKNWGTWRVQSDDQCNDYHRDCQNQQAQERTYYVKSTLRYQVQLLLFQYRFCYLSDYIGGALLCQTAARCCCHISHIPTLISVSLPPHRFSTKPSRGKGSTQILNLQIAVQKYPFKVRNSSKYRLRHSCTKTNIFCQCRCVSGAFVEFATPLQKQRRSLAMQGFSRFYDIHLH